MKLLAFDLDGTLLTSKQRIADSSLEVIRAFLKQGNRMCIVTGRNYDLVKPIVDLYQLDCDLLLNNGHQLITKDGTIQKESSMSDQTARAILEILIAYDFLFTVHTTKGKYIFEDIDTFFDNHIKIVKQNRGDDFDDVKDSPLMKKDIFLANTHEVTSIDEFMETGAKILKIDARNFDAEKRVEGRLRIDNLPELAVHSSYEAFMEITSKDANKATLLLEYANSLQISKDDVYVFGDSMNDYEMFETFTNTIAMANADKPILELAKYITDTNDNDGIYKAIKTIL
ncbi:MULTISPECIES: HAD family hydrolase [unclassified Breznakia]|uniref:HAD family hydrolase n=1 Tax=unclassified Breznakia TaxID=2623764 RepID=UPI002475F411|nr:MULTISPECIES: HAD family hydrolase [unclassified Breznakia]MDH6367995.1 Cof subfamily protein (haloacid dehalogenase superfamily) [Breznakia sp. PH1-1]MDH6405074.1 Cof subfamily protein (haloacid dehalogenase superfamily) [Breznakia sp. PF1-11]MDH6412798.1 Cof subfamily protein (haloacid dehalogenase superfamily) [Breznakia sp. PFB1-11]MDH6415149.1 Cof subfamily protein (haloacid dehalogenase superfamily) [Breznakia sp. PFB1-14]MDH6417460.1 Cof subfamily protein (haloacid dehalogenase super